VALMHFVFLISSSIATNRSSSLPPTRAPLARATPQLVHTLDRVAGTMNQADVDKQINQVRRNVRESPCVSRAQQRARARRRRNV